ncbi:mucin-22-like [Ptychodera flava]|uniref:mucin-22-like n=1 Tax=Ptychodera flava TaxID=63121 RepID=UPI00396A9F63
MREIAGEVGIKLQLKAIYNLERFKEVELFFINRDGGGIHPMKIHDVLAEDSAEDVQMSSNKAAESGYVEDNVADISEDDLKQGKVPSKLLLLEVDPALKINLSSKTRVQTMFKAEKCIRLKGRQCDMLQVLTTNTDTVQHILSCRQDVLALLGVTRYLLTDAPTQDMDTQEMEVQLNGHGTKVLTPPIPDEKVSLLARSLLPCQISQIQITEYIVKQLLAQISENDLQKSVLHHQLEEAKQEKATLVEHIRKLTQTIDITEKELTKRVDKSMYEKLSSELKEKEKIICDLEAKLSGLEEIFPELKIQGKDEMKIGSQYYEDEEGPKDVIVTTLDDAMSKTKLTDNQKDKTLPQSTSVRQGSEMEAATPTQPEMTVREGSEMETATPTQPEMTGRDGSEMETATPTQPEMTVREGSEMETATPTQPEMTVREGSEMETATPTQPEMTVREGSEMETATSTQPEMTVREGSEMETATSTQPEMTVREGSEMETATSTQPEMTVRDGSEMETATPTQPEMIGRDGSEMETATPTQPQVLGEGIRKDTTMLPEVHVAEKSVHEERLVAMGKEHQKQKKDSGGIFSKISKRIFGRKEKSDGSTVMPESKQEQRSSVSTGVEEMPSGSVSSKMTGGAATTGSKQEQSSVPGGEKMPTGSVSSKMSSGTATTGSKQEQSSVTGGEEMPSGSVSSKMSGGTATTGSKQEQSSVPGGEEMPTGSVSSKMSSGTATAGSTQEQRGSVTAGGEKKPSDSVSSKMSGGTATTRSKSEHWSRRTLKGHQGHKFKDLKRLAFHNDKLLVCDSDSNIVHVLNQDYTCEKELGSFSGQFAKPFKPWSIAVSQDNLYFILDNSNVQIVVCDQNNKVIRIITLPADSDPRCIALVKGFVIVTEVNGHRILKYSLDGMYIGEFGRRGDGHTEFNYPPLSLSTVGMSSWCLTVTITASSVLTLSSITCTNTVSTVPAMLSCPTHAALPLMALTMFMFVITAMIGFRFGEKIQRGYVIFSILN